MSHKEGGAPAAGVSSSDNVNGEEMKLRQRHTPTQSNTALSGGGTVTRDEAVTNAGVKVSSPLKKDGGNMPMGKPTTSDATVPLAPAAGATTTTTTTSLGMEPGGSDDEPTNASWSEVTRADSTIVNNVVDTRPGSIARKMHKVFAYTAIPSGVMIGLYFFALLIKARIEAHTVGRVIAGYCAIMTVLMTSLLIYLHLSAYTDPVQQRRIIRILLMVPIYAVDSFIALWKYELAPIMGLARDCYEAYVIYTFYNLLMGYLGGEENALLQSPASRVKHMFPFCCFKDFTLTKETLKTWKLLLTQFLILKPVLSVLAIFLMLGGYYDEGSWSFSNPHVHFVIILNISVTCAFTSLVYFFVQFRDALVAHQPLGKFAAVKAVIFLSFWQSVILGLLVHYGVITASKEGLWSPDDVSTGVQDFLICIEMLIMCFVHHKVFPVKPYVPPTGYHTVKCWQILHMFSVKDVMTEAFDTVKDVTPSISIPSIPKVFGGGGGGKGSGVSGNSVVVAGTDKKTDASEDVVKLTQ